MWKCTRVDAGVTKYLWGLFPSIMICVNDDRFYFKNFIVELHFLCLHCRFLFIKVLKMFAEIIGVVVVGVVCVIAIMVELFSNGADYE